MYSKYPRFEQAVRDKVVTPASIQSRQPGYGIILKFDPTSNTATVLMAQPNSDAPGEIFDNVPCPVTKGVQGVAPELGRPVWLAFRDGTQSTPMITSFFSFSYAAIDHDSQYYASHDVPSFMMDL